MDWVTGPLRRYAQFRGRAARREYWLWQLFLIVAIVLLSIADTKLGLGGSFDRHADFSGPGLSAGFAFNGGLLTWIFALAVLLPSLALSVRRLHDTDKSAWWLLLVLVLLFGWIALLVFTMTEGTRGANRFGPDPIARSAPDF